MFFGRFLETRSECDEGFARTSFAQKRDEFDVVVEEAIEGKVLLFVSRFDAPAPRKPWARRHE